MQSINETKKPKKGRPAVDSEPVNLRLPRHLVDAVDEFRRQQTDIPSRPEAIRRLISTGIKAEPILRDVMKMLVELRGVGPEHELDVHIKQIMDALGKDAPESRA